MSRAKLKAAAERQKSILAYIASFEPADIDSDTVDLRFEDENGCDTGGDVSIVEECRRSADLVGELIAALEAAEGRVAELENDEVRQRLANAEHQIYMAELAKNNLRASRKAQFKKRKAAEARIAELEARKITVRFDAIPMSELGNVSDGKAHPYLFGAGYNSATVRCKSELQLACAAAGINLETGGEA